MTDLSNPIFLQAINRLKAKKDAQLPTIDPVDWIEHHFYIPELRAPMKVAPYQARALREALHINPDGNFKYSTIIWGEIKKSAKTSISAGVMDWLMSNMPYSSGKFVANTLDQATSRASKMLNTNFQLHPRPGIEVIPSRNLVRYPNQSEVKSIPINPSAEAGGNDSIVAFDEIWGAHEEAKETMWTEMTLSPTRMGKSFRWVSSYAGYLGESNLLWSLYQQGVDEYAQFPGQGRRFDWCDEFDPPLECYYNESARLFCLWNTVPRLDWQTPAYYAQEASILVPSEFNRVHRNQWSAAVEAFVPIEWWDACKVEKLPDLGDEPCICGIDAAVSSDCFGIVLVSRHGDQIAVRYARQWSPRGGKIRFVNEDDPDDRNYPEGELRWLYNNYNILEFAYDPMHLPELPPRLQRAGYGFYRPFLQGKPRLEGDKMLYDLISHRRIMHRGDTDLRSHIQNANAEIKGEKSMRLVKRAPTLHIDLAVSLSMAADRAMTYRI